MLVAVKNQNIFTSKARELVQVISARKEQSESNIDITHDRIVDEDFEYTGSYKCLEEEEILTESDLCT